MRGWIDSSGGYDGGSLRGGLSESFHSSATIRSGSDRSTTSGGEGSAAAEAGSEGRYYYEEDEFDEYESDSFESVDEDANTSVAGANPERGASQSAAWSTGDRVQVFWADEGAWFDGVVTDRSGTEVQVHYDDGDVTWEGGGCIRAHPSTFGIAQYAPLSTGYLSTASPSELETQLLGKTVAVYWPNEAAWFCGRVCVVEADPRALLIKYDDGDSRWQHHAELHHVVLLSEGAGDQSTVQSTAWGVQTAHPPPVPTERLLTPRPYRAAVRDHFQPVRLARADRFVGCVASHMGSVVEPRPNYSARRYLHATRLECDVFDRDRRPDVDAKDSATQTLVALHADGAVD